MRTTEQAGMPWTPPRELVVASAGAGKTFRLSSRIIELLDAGAEPSEVLASTFTRKAAGEILERVLVRLARGALAPGGMEHPVLPPHRCLDLLSTVVRRLHTVNVGTLDSFFQRVARAFGLELGLPPVWGLSGGPADEALRARAVSVMLSGSDRGETLEMVRGLQGGEAGQGVHRLLMERVAALHDLYREVDPSAPDPWGFAADFLAELGPLPGPREVAEVAAAVLAGEVATTKAGKPNQRWVNAQREAAALILDQDWDGFLSKGIQKKLVQGERLYSKAVIPDSLAQGLEQGIALARRALGWPAHQRTLALAALLRRYHGAVEALREAEGRYRFDDVTRALGRALALNRGDELHYRLDARIRHILLDEFQDTSLGQWWALRPLVDEILSGHRDERGAVIVADPKQSIYGWRGGEPRILEGIERDFTLERQSLSLSYRSSQVVLDLVNQVFGGLEAGGVLSEEHLPAARRWLKGFDRHEAHFSGLPGYVRILSGPEGDSARSSIRPRLLAAAARRVAELHDACPAAEIGVLVRTNRGVGRLMAELRRLGVDASGEGGVPVVDSPAVLSVLALLRVADHPGDVASRYQIATTPVAALAPPGFQYRSGDDAEAMAWRIRRRLLREGYGPVLAGWVRDLVDAPGAGPTPRDRRRLGQLVELGHRWDADGAGLRPGDFVRWVRDERVQEPSAAGVRIMTVHQSKGLEFDVVILPDLDQPLLPRGRGQVIPFRPHVDGPITRVFPALKSDHLPLFPQARAASLQGEEAGLRDGLSSLYVALTRARFGVEVFLAPDGKNRSSATTAARVVRASLASLGLADSLGPDELLPPDTVIHTRGTERWWDDPEAPERVRRSGGRGSGSADGGRSAEMGAAAHAKGAVEAAGTVSEYPDAPVPSNAPVPSDVPGPSLFRQSSAATRNRLLPRRTPSELEGGGRVRLGHLLLQEAERARSRGSLIHAWFEAVGWVEDGSPGDDELMAVARRMAGDEPESELRALVGRFREWIGHPAFAAVLSAASYPPGARLHRERPFLFRDREGGRLLQGVVDRLVVDPVGQRAWILDFKTDRHTDPGVLSERYAPQLAVYREAVAREEGLDPSDVETALVVLEAGRVQEVDPVQPPGRFPEVDRVHQPGRLPGTDPGRGPGAG